MPRRSATPGRNGSNMASACSTSWSTTSTPSGDLRSTATDRLPRWSRSPGGRLGVAEAGVLGPVDLDDVGAQVGQHEAGERAGADAGDLDDAGACEGSGSHVGILSHRLDQVVKWRPVYMRPSISAFLASNSAWLMAP